MIYADAWRTTCTAYEIALAEGWGEEWISADAHVSMADYDFQHGIINDVDAYNDDN